MSVPPRTTAAAVQGILVNDWDGITDVTPYIQTASSIVDKVVQCATWKNVTLNSVDQELIERWLSAHYYTKMDPVYTSKSTSGASGSFVRGKEEPEPYKAAAQNVDISGCLKAILGRQVARGYHVGGGFGFGGPAFGGFCP
jgi:hypothetical protein